jgi:hypothetical protein
MHVLKLLQLKQQLLNIQAEHWLRTACSGIGGDVKDAVKRIAQRQLDAALAVNGEIAQKEKELLQVRLALIAALKADPSASAPEHFCWIK